MRIDRIRLMLVLAALTAGTCAFAEQAQVQESEYNSHYTNHKAHKRYTPKEKFSVRFGVGTSSTYNANRFVYGDTYRNWYEYDYELSYQNPLGNYYSDYNGPTKSAGTYSIGAEYLVTRWFAVGMDLGIERLWHTNYSGRDNSPLGKEKGTALIVMPQVRFYYMNKRNVRLYGYMGAGFVKSFGFDKLTYTYEDYRGRVKTHDESFVAVTQFTPIGIEVGKTLHAFAELGDGSMFSGLRFGIGYRF